MLEHLCKNNNLWYSIALKICKEDQEAKDLVQDMYLKCYEKKIPIEKLTNSYVHWVIMNIYRDKVTTLRHKFTERMNDSFDVKQPQEDNSFCDIDLSYLEKAKELKIEDQTILSQTYTTPLRAVASINNISTNKVFRKIKAMREYILGEDYDLKYSNIRCKYKKTV